MKCTKEKIFSSSAEMLQWKKSNCDICQKAIDGKKAVCYRCALQRDIDKQHSDNRYEVNERSLKILKGVDKCPYLRPKTQVVEISTQKEKRSENEEKSPNSRNDVQHIVRSGSAEREFAPEEYAKAEKKVLDAIWINKVKPNVLNPFSRFMPKREVNEDVVKIVAQHDADALLRTFTWDDCMQIAFVPLVISKIAWTYAERTMKQCAELRIPAFKKLCREIRNLRKKYIDFISLDLNRAHLDKVESKAEQLMTMCNYDFTIMWFQMNQYIKTNAYGIPYDKMRTDALMAIAIVRFLKEHDERMNAIVSKKLAISKSVTNPMMIQLSELLKNFLPAGFSFGTNSQIDMCDRIFHNNLKKVVFEQDECDKNIKL